MQVVYPLFLDTTDEPEAKHTYSPSTLADYEKRPSPYKYVRFGSFFLSFAYLMRLYVSLKSLQDGPDARSAKILEEAVVDLP
jgi:hypothetical protein